jgi:hypothetical protein
MPHDVRTQLRGPNTAQLYHIDHIELQTGRNLLLSLAALVVAQGLCHAIV